MANGSRSSRATLPSGLVVGAEVVVLLISSEVPRFALDVQVVICSARALEALGELPDASSLGPGSMLGLTRPAETDPTAAPKPSSQVS